MSYMSELSQSNEYLSFRSSIPLRKIVVDSDSSKAWKIFDCGPKSVTCPLVCLPPVSGTADIFFKQVMGLASRGVRVIAAEPPPYWNMKEWCDGFKRLLDYLELHKVHIFGASLGGFIGQKFTELTRNYPRVASLVLCNTFTDTSVFEYNDSAALFWLLPSLVLKRMLMGNFTTDKVDRRMAESIDFMVERLESLTQSELASRLTINCSPCYIQPHLINNIPITVMDVWDESALSSRVREDLYKSYPNAKLAHLKSGGNFPYLSRSDEVNLHLLTWTWHNRKNPQACKQSNKSESTGHSCWDLLISVLGHTLYLLFTCDLPVSNKVRTFADDTAILAFGKPLPSSKGAFTIYLLGIHLRQFDGTEFSASYLSLHKMPSASNNNPEEGSVSYFNQREKFVQIA